MRTWVGTNVNKYCLPRGTLVNVDLVICQVILSSHQPSHLCVESIGSAFGLWPSCHVLDFLQCSDFIQASAKPLPSEYACLQIISYLLFMNGVMLYNFCSWNSVNVICLHVVRVYYIQSIILACWKGRPRLRWMDDAELDLRNICVKRWMRRALDNIE
jgi:hypothetical protein